MLTMSIRHAWHLYWHILNVIRQDLTLSLSYCRGATSAGQKDYTTNLLERILQNANSI